MARVNRVLPLQAPRKRLRNETAPRPRSTDNVKTLLKRSHRSPLAVTNHKAGAVKNQAPRVDKHVRISGASVRHDERRRQPSKRSEETAISLRFSEATAEYRSSVDESSHKDLELVYQEHCARLDQTPTLAKRVEGDKDGQQSASVQDLVASIRPLTDRLDDAVVNVRYVKPDGSESRKKIAFGETATRFEAKVAEKRQELADLWHEWDQVQNEMLKLASEMTGDPDFASHLRGGAIIEPVESATDAVAKELYKGIDEMVAESVKEVDAMVKEEDHRRKIRANQFNELLKMDQE